MLSKVITVVSAVMSILALMYLAYNLYILKSLSCAYNYQAETKNAQYAVHKDKLKVSLLEQSSTEPLLNYLDSQQLNQLLCSPISSDVNMLNSTVQSKTLRNYRVVEPPLNAAVSRACSGMFDRRRVLWITGPPGSGKTTLALRFQEYGFMAMDCEDPWANFGNRTKNLIRASQFVLENGTTTHVFAACFVKILWSKPPNIDVAVLFPNSKVYRQRWMARNPNDLQNPSKQWKFTSDLAKSFKKDASVHIIHQSSSAECIDQTIYKICNKVLSKEG